MSTIKTRVRNKNDTKAHWDLAEQFKPLKGEIILYTDTRQMKVGDGETLVGALPFYPSGDVTAAGNNTFTGTNIFKDNPIQIEKTSPNPGPNYPGIYITNERLLVSGGDTVSSQVIITAEEVGISTPSGYCSLEKNGIIKNGDSSDTTFSLTLPKKNGTLATTDDIDVKAASANTFTGQNTFLTSTKFGDTYGCTISGSLFCLSGNTNNSMQLDFYNSKILFKDVRHSSYGTILQADMNVGYGTANATITLPRKTGTLALTNYVTANPTADGTTELTKLKVGDVVYTLPSGGGGSGDVTAAGDNTFTGSNSFTNGISLNDPSTAPTANSITALSKDGFKYVQAAATVANTITFQTLPNGSVGKSYTIPLLETNNTFTGNNTFTKAITTTDVNGFIIAPGADAGNYKASIDIDPVTLLDNQGDIYLEIYRSGVIATEEWTTAQLQGLFTYANNTLTINV